MHQVKVDLINTKQVGALIEGPEGLVVPVIGVPDFGGQENLVTG